MTCPPGVLPNSGAKEEVSTRNSCNASTETRLLVPPKALNACAAPVPDWATLAALTPKFPDTPSTVKLFAFVRWPATLNWPGEKAVVGAMTTPGVSCRSVLKLRPLSGKLSTKFLSITVLTEPDCVFTSGAPAVTVTTSDAAPTGRVKLIASASCTLRVISGLMSVLNPIFET
jgi:hypothetical protein